MGIDVFIRAEVSPVARLSKGWVCVRPLSAVLGGRDPGYLCSRFHMELVGHRDEEEALTSSCTEGHGHTSLLGDLRLFSAAGRDWHYQKQTIYMNWPALTAALSLVSLLFIAR